MKLVVSSKSVSLAFFILMSSCGYEVDGLDASSQGQWDERWRETPRYWGSHSFPLDIAYSEDFNSDFMDGDIDEDGHNPLERSLLEWDSVIESRSLFSLPLRVVANKEYANIEHYKDDEMGIYKHSLWFDQKRARQFHDAIAVAQLYLRPRNLLTSSEYLEVVHADILFNYRDYSFSTDPGSSPSHDIQSVSVHEIGHLLGFRHQDYGTISVMNPSLSLYQKRRNVSAYDKMYAARAYGSNAGSQAANALYYALTPQQEEGDLIRVIVALKPGGECLHYVPEDGRVSRHSLLGRHRHSR